MHKEAKKSMSCRGSRAWTSVRHSGTEHKHPQVYRAQGVDMLRKTEVQKIKSIRSLQFERYGLLCVLGSIFCSSPTQKCLSSS
jgi:hypothetical protein